MLPADPFGRSSLPTTVAAEGSDTFSREARVRLLAEAGRMLIDSGTVAGVFAGGGLLSWLEEGGTLGSLERDFWKVAAPHRSTVTPARLWQRSSRRGTDADSLDTLETPASTSP